LTHLREVSDRFVLFPVGRDYACVAGAGSTVMGAVLVRVAEQKIAAVRLVTCPTLLRQLQILMAVNGGEDFQGETQGNRN
jgi:hypothetical protein